MPRCRDATVGAKGTVVYGNELSEYRLARARPVVCRLMFAYALVSDNPVESPGWSALQESEESYSAVISPAHGLASGVFFSKTKR